MLLHLYYFKLINLANYRSKWNFNLDTSAFELNILLIVILITRAYYF